ncbi:MAG: tetratricopeptide repeat protein [Phycisphaerae bacterium]
MRATQSVSFRAAMSGRWQIPLLAVSLCVLGGGLNRMIAAREPLTFEQRLEKVRVLREAGALTRAHAYLVYLLKDPDRPSEEKAELHRRLVGTLYQAEAAFRHHNPKNLRAIITNFYTAVRYGADPRVSDWIALANAYQWSGQTEDAIKAFRQALHMGPPRPDRIRRQLAELLSPPGAPLPGEAVAAIEEILEDDTASSENYLWAVERKIDRLLARGETAEALALARRAKERLAGTAERLAVEYSEALCLHKSGRSDRAEILLRSLRNQWTVHDELWGRSGWLLGQIEQAEDRPQSALSFYDEVLAAFRTGDLHDACEFGRAQCLVRLERYDRALEVFERVKDVILAAGPDSRLDRDVVRASITTAGETVFQAGRRRLALRFSELGLALTDASDWRLRSQYAFRIAAGLAALAEEVSNGATGSAASAEARDLFARAGEMFVLQADLQQLDEDGAVLALQRAADNFDAAGRIDRVIDALRRVVKEHPAHRDRADALFRLGEAYRAVEDFAGAIAAYDEVIREYRRLPAALRAMVPLAESLLKEGGPSAQRGVRLLIDIVDDRGPDPLFEPQATEYRQALFQLAEYYSRADQAEVPDHWALAITRLEDAVALYPDDPQIPRLRFLLAEAYRRSAQVLREDKTARRDAAVTAEASRRLELALANYRRVRDVLARQDADALSALEETYLRTSYLYIGDCLFDLGRLDQAIEAYREVAWRYENEPAAVSATTQVVHCFERLARPAEARAALARLQWLLRKIPARAFDAERGMSSKSYWEALVRRMAQTGLF